jgi:Dyp-type peroxidase family
MPLSETLLPKWGDTQGLVLSGYGHLDAAVYTLYRINDDGREAALEWIRRLGPEITPALRRPLGEWRPQGSPHENGEHRGAVNIALTFSGLTALCEARGWTAEGFSAPFVERIDGDPSGHRQRILGDLDENSSQHWGWGGSHKRVDILLMLFAENDAELGALEARYLPPPGLTLVEQVRATSLDEMDGREHFGFLDGLSQPILRGSRDAERYPESRHLTELGEIVLGYPNADGATPAAPRLSGDPQFGKNGTYLVARQLRQDVHSFWRFVYERAGADVLAADRLAAKIVGRQRDGTPLVPYTSARDNEFGYAEDPYGHGCPIGSHVRRANPRDTFDNTNVPPLSPRAANRHRVVRRGRAYGPVVPSWDPEILAQAGDAAERGLLFVCLNADLERQFEFIQGDWINNSGFAGLAGERDPLVGRPVNVAGHSVNTAFTLQGLPAPGRVTGPNRFVTVRGGEYFFLPGLRALRHLANGSETGGPRA